MLYVTSFYLSLMLIHLVKEAQIALLLTKEVKILDKYSDFLENKILELSKISDLN